MGESKKCQFCNNPATVHLTQIVENKIYKVDLCESCAKQKGVTDPEGFSLAELLAQPSFAVQSGGDAVVCEECGFNAKDFKRLGRLGCPSCYDQLGHLVRPMLKNIHRGCQHEGKVPERSLARISRERKLLDLETALQNAVAEERYEDAANIRDEIKALTATAE